MHARQGGLRDEVASRDTSNIELISRYLRGVEGSDFFRQTIRELCLSSVQV